MGLIHSGNATAALHVSRTARTAGRSTPPPCDPTWCRRPKPESARRHSSRMRGLWAMSATQAAARGQARDRRRRQRLLPHLARRAREGRGQSDRESEHAWRASRRPDRIKPTRTVSRLAPLDVCRGERSSDELVQRRETHSGPPKFITTSITRKEPRSSSCM